MLGKIQKSSVQDLVFDTLKTAILDGTFKCGDKLPSENELCEQLGVSRPSVKSAIQRLCTLSVVETRPGDGSYVTAFNPAAFFGQVSDFLVGKSNINEAAEYRCRMQIMYAELAMERITPQEKATLENILDGMDAAVAARDLDRMGQLDYRFHTEIVRATHNEFILKMYEMMQDVDLQYIYLENRNFFRELDEGLPGDHGDVHRAIYESIITKDLARCRAIYEKKYAPIPEYYAE